MGNETHKLSGDAGRGKQKDAAALPDALNIKKYTKIGVIGRGGFGKVSNLRLQVWKIENKKDRKHYALKEMSKARYFHLLF